MTKTTPFRDREAAWRPVLPTSGTTVLRMDGKAFHTYTRGLLRPYDALLMACMDDAAKALCAAAQGVRYAHVQSDEISVRLDADAEAGSQPWLGGVLPKLLSVSASVVTAAFNAATAHRGLAVRGPAHFDARALHFTPDEEAEVDAYFAHRVRDGYRNAVTMIAQVHASHRKLHGLNTAERIALVERAGDEPGRYPAGFLPARVTRRRWVASPWTTGNERE